MDATGRTTKYIAVALGLCYIKGMIIWVKDENQRVYHDKDGVKHSTPIQRGYWVPYEVISETTRSWVLPYGRKVPKNTQFPTSYLALSEEQVDDICWFDENIHKVVNAIQRLGYGIERHKNIQTLHEVAKVIGYKA